MRKVILIFPDSTELSDFILHYKSPGGEVNTAENSLTSFLSEELIVIACTLYRAQLKELIFAL